MITSRVRGDRFPVLKAPVGAACVRAPPSRLAARCAALCDRARRVASAGAWRRVPCRRPPVTIDGPSADIVGLSGMSLARDGTGGLVYLKQVLGTSHVFVSRLVDGAFQAPEQVDGGLIGGSSQPVIAAGNGGLLLIAFVNGGQLYVVVRPNASAAYVGPLALANAASNPAIAMTNFGKAYLAFTVASATGHDVRTAYYYNGAWSLAPTALDAFPGDDAGTDTGRPAVAAATDGVGIVAWGEGGHVYTRRVWGASPSVVYEQADVPPPARRDQRGRRGPARGRGRRRLLLRRGRLSRGVRARSPAAVPRALAAAAGLAVRRRERGRRRHGDGSRRCRGADDGDG